MTIIFDRELCSKVLKETFLLFLFLLAWNQVKKNVREQNLLQSQQKMFGKQICSKLNKKCLQMKTVPNGIENRGKKDHKI